MMSLKWLKFGLISTATVAVTYICLPVCQYSYNVICTGQCSTRLYAELSQACKASSCISAQSLIQSLRQQFPVLDHVAVRYKADGCACVECSVQSPCVYINKQYVITDKNVLVDASYFDEHIFSSCVCMTCNRIDQVTAQVKELVHFAQNISPSVAHKFDVAWNDKLNIFLTSTTKSLKILSLYDTKLTDARLRIIESLYAKKMQEKGNKKNLLLIADARFEHQVIVRESVKRG